MTAWITAILIGWKLNEKTSVSIAGAVIFILIFLTAFLAYLIAERLLLKALKVIVVQSKTKWDDILLEHHVFERMVLIIPALVIYVFAPMSVYGQAWLHKLAVCFLVFALLQTFDKFLNAANEMYKKSEAAKTRPLKGLLQVLKITAYAIGLIIIVSLIMDRSPTIILGGVGAASAVLLLIFKDTLLGFVASIQLTENDMVRLDDWIEMPVHGADGAVTDISLHTVKVENWDKSVTTIPTYAMVSESFKNWRSMQEMGGRRIKRAVNIDITSVQFCTKEKLEKYREIQYISEYLSQKTEELQEYNQKHVKSSNRVNGRHLTNLGIFRIYLEKYLRNHPHIHQKMTRLVRQLEPTEHGIPIELYVFTNTTDWNAYEAIQADIFDHILAVIPEFDLRIFQNPTGHDLAKLYITDIRTESQ
ncbi:mechanosensitive ion channel family protein [Sinanaerobacter sp. ZZT-01]|uniref:mechanosensitive ion channel family protein n=1 Tax=Sinanaerobacter sp. ZZT-01 TaxID=3111540 RepID=UPI002D76BE6F|nr:mechanosensitive ion channel domain-containing protein [Sinanaerobacter sp. ZZT-01]WRR92997.1 mechanosensitive ion channel domain-containing protein [Sinanaerobacter sp. ZZT-01]